jgi:antitoxin (DNA-binding transcriptional repressor) of toxin-antitoxin stability system
MEIAMATVSVAEAKDRLAALISAAEAGETITITRHGKPVAELRAPSSKKKFDPKSIDWIREQTAHMKPMSMTGAEIVRAMRDED